MDEYTPAQVFDGLMLLGDDAPDPDPDRHVDLQAALARLKPAHAIACRLYAQGYTGTEIGRRLGRSGSAGRHLLPRALKALIAEMNGEIKHVQDRASRRTQKRQVNIGQVA